MRIRFLLPVLFMIHSFAMAQVVLSDPAGKSLRKQIRESKPDSNRVKLCLQYGFLWENQSLDSAGAWYLRAGSLSDKINYPLGQIKFRSNYTYILNLKGDFAESVKRNQECLELARKYPQLQYINKSLTNLGISYIYLGKYEESIRYLQQAADGFQKNGQAEMVPGIYSKMGKAMAAAGLPEKALPYNLKALEMQRTQAQDTIQLIESLTGIFTNYTALEKYREALPYLQEARVLAEAIHSTMYMEESISFLGSAYRNLGQFDSSMKYHKRAYALVRNSENVMLKMTVLKGLTMLYHQAKDDKNEERYTREAIQLGEDENLREGLMGCYQQLGLLLAKKKDYQSAYNLMLKYQAIYDSVQSQSIKKQIVALDSRYRNAEKEKQILSLENERQKQKTYIFGLGAGLVALALIGFLGYRNMLNRKKIAEKEIVQLRQERQLIATNSILKGQDEERSRLARDLHDGLGGMLSGLKFSLNNMKGNVILDEENASVFEKSIGQLDDVIAEMRRVAHSMMPEALVRFGLKEATEDLCDQVAKTSGMQVHFQVIGMDEELEKSLSAALYRIGQELLNNIVKHAGATEVQVQLVRDENQVSLTIEDNGKGFDLQKLKPGVGLTSIQNRVEALGGRLDIQSGPESGTSILVEITV